MYIVPEKLLFFWSMVVVRFIYVLQVILCSEKCFCVLFRKCFLFHWKINLHQKLKYLELILCFIALSVYLIKESDEYRIGRISYSLDRDSGAKRRGYRYCYGKTWPLNITYEHTYMKHDSRVVSLAAEKEGKFIALTKFPWLKNMVMWKGLAASACNYHKTICKH